MLVQNQWVPVKKTVSPKLNFLGLLYNHTDNYSKERLHNSVLQFTEIENSFHHKAQQRRKEIMYISINNSHKNSHGNHTNRIFYIFRSINWPLRPMGHMPWIILFLLHFLCVRDAGCRGNRITIEYSCSSMCDTFLVTCALPLFNKVTPTPGLAQGHFVLFLVNPYTTRTNEEVCRLNPMVLPFKWNLFSSTFTWYYLFSM